MNIKAYSAISRLFAETASVLMNMSKVGDQNKQAMQQSR